MGGMEVGAEVAQDLCSLGGLLQSFCLCCSSLLFLSHPSHLLLSLFSLPHPSVPQSLHWELK